MENETPNLPGDDRLRIFVALLLTGAYVILLLLMPWVPEVREPLLFLGPFVGAIVGYAFGNRTRQSDP